MKSPFAWPGGKRALLKTLLASIPPHEAYIEVFAGSAKLLLAKEPSKFEALNDLNGDVINFFRVAKHRPAELAERLELECIHAARFRELRSEAAPHDELERAMRFAYLVWHSFGAKGEHFASATAASLRIGHTLDAVRGLLQQTAKRLSRVMIEQRDFMEILDRYDAPGSFFYLDPPYTQYEANGRYQPLPAARRDELFERLARLKGSFLLSFDDCGEIRARAREHGFSLRPVEARYTLRGADKPTRGREVLVSGPHGKA